MVSEKNHRKGRRGRPPNKGPTVGREAIIKATEKLLQSNEPASVTRLMVAEQAAVDPQLIRYYFGTVENLLGEVALVAQQQVREQVEAALGVESPIERLEQRVQDRIELFLGHPKHHKLISAILEERPQSKHRKEWAEIAQLSLAEITETIELGAKRNELRNVDPVLLHLTILGACEFVANNQKILRILRGRNTPKKKLASEFYEFFVDLLMNGLKAEKPKN